MQEEKRNQAYSTAGLLLAIAANISSAAVTLWDFKTSTDNDLWMSSTWYFVVVGATIIALFIGLPLNIAALSYWSRKADRPKVATALVGSCLCFLPWVMPVITERYLFGLFRNG